MIYFIIQRILHLQGGIMAADKNTMFNLKLRASRRKKFKSTTHDYGTTMQAVLSAFVESYIENPDKFRTFHPDSVHKYENFDNFNDAKSYAKRMLPELPMESSVIGINEFDVEIICQDENGENSVNVSQEQLDKIAYRTRELLDKDLGEYFWNCFDDCLHFAIFEILQES